MTGLWVALGIVLLVLCLGILLRRSLRRQQEAVATSWRQVRGALDARHGLLAALAGRAHELGCPARVPDEVQAALDALPAEDTGLGRPEPGLALAEQRLAVAEQRLLRLVATEPRLADDAELEGLRERLAQAADRAEATRRVHNASARAHALRRSQQPLRLLAGGLPATEPFELGRDRLGAGRG